MMNRFRGTDVLAHLQGMMNSNRALKAEYDRLGPRYQVISSIIRGRKAAGLTDSELARRMQVSLPVLRRLHSGNQDPRFELIRLCQNSGSGRSVASST